MNPMLTLVPPSIPFFYEPAFNAEVKPLAAALRIQADSMMPAHPNRFANGGNLTYDTLATILSDSERNPSSSGGDDKANKPAKLYEPIIYGDFLLSKVGSNFQLAEGEEKKGRY
jgi:hypothetical protein